MQTDQTCCYDAAGSVIPLRRDRPDAALNAGVPGPCHGFWGGRGNGGNVGEVSGETVIDTLTHLMWPRNAGLFEFPLSLDEAFTAVEQMNRDRMFGFSDWRMPKRHELFSLVEPCPGQSCPACRSSIHPCVSRLLPDRHPLRPVSPPDMVCSSGWRLFKGMKAGSYMVWPVRRLNAVQSDADDGSGVNHGSRFFKDGQTVLDRKNGLMWTQNADLAAGPVAWMDAFTFTEAMNRDRNWGYDDWRLPNIRELESITDMDRHSPAIAGADLFDNLQPFYWSSTTSVYDPRYAWTLYTEDGNLGWA
ncbi:MAG: DUF1566 domain-containing protein [Desulfobacterales bacterium]